MVSFSGLNDHSSTIGALIAALEEKDDYTAGHSERVAEFSGMIAQSMGG